MPKTSDWIFSQRPSRNHSFEIFGGKYSLVAVDRWYDIQKFVNKCPECGKKRPSLNDSTNRWEACSPWERLHMDWLYEAEHGNILIIVDATYGWLEPFRCTDRSTRNVVRCFRSTFSRFGIQYTVVSNNGKEFLSEDLKDWLAAQGCKKIDTLLYSPRSNWLAERALQVLKSSLKFYKKDIGCSITTYIEKVFSVIEYLQILEVTLLPNFCLEKIRESLLLDFTNLVKRCCANPLQTMSRKIDLHYPERTNTAWIHDNNRTVLASDRQIASLPSSVIVKLEPQSNIRHVDI